jgi:hypothetical protein
VAAAAPRREHNGRGDDARREGRPHAQHPIPGVVNFD